MLRFIILSIFLICKIANAQSSDSIIRDKDTLALSQVEFEFAKSSYIEMLHTNTYKKTRQMAADMELKVNYNRIPMSSDTELISWLTENLHATNFKSVNEGLEIICPYIAMYEKLYRENLNLYDLMAKATFEQFKEITKPELHLTKEDLMITD